MIVKSRALSRLSRVAVVKTSPSPTARVAAVLSLSSFPLEDHVWSFLIPPTGIGLHDKIGIISNNRWEWAALAVASFSLNAAIVPIMYETQLPKDLTYTLNDSQCKALFTRMDDIFVKVTKETLPNVPLVKESFCFNTPSGKPHSLATAIDSAKGRYTQVILSLPPKITLYISIRLVRQANQRAWS